MDFMDPTLMTAIGGIVVAYVILSLKSSKKIPAPPKPWGVFDDYGVLWNRESSGLKTGKPDDQLRAFPDADTGYAIMAAACVKGGAGLTAGKRKLLKRHWVDLNGKPVEKLTLADEYTYMTFKEFGETMHQIGAGFVSWAKCAANECVIIYAETAREWMLAAQGAFTQGLTVVTVYATLGEAGLIQGAKQTKAKVVVADAKLLKILANVFKDPAAKTATKALKKVVYIADAPEERDLKMEKDVQDAVDAISAAGVEVITLDDLIKKGKSKMCDPRPPKPSDLAIIMYTSGTTGDAKGVKLSHGNLVATVAGLERKVPSLFGGSSDFSSECYLAYMPLAHIMEMAGELMAFSMNIRIGYGSPHTLTPTGVKIMPDTCLGDAAVCQPTLLVLAPAILDKVYGGLQLKMKSQSPLIQKLFAWGVAAGAKRYDKGLVGAPFLYNAIVFKKVQKLLGGKLKACITGSAPLAPGIQKFAQTAFNCPVRQGYGLTETCASSCIGEVCDNTTGQVGTPTVCTCIKLRDWEEGGYRLSDASDPEVGMPRGEILIGGSMVCQGYLIDPANPDPDVVQKNKTEFVVDERGMRFFCTGDIGQITKEGTLMIIDRKKDLVKLQQGEYVALSKVENVLKLCPIVEYPMVYAESSRDFCVALICPNHGMLKKLAVEMGLKEQDVAKLCSMPEVEAEVAKRCLAACKQGKLVPFETPRKIALIADTFTPDNECLTAAMKLKRPFTAKLHAATIKRIYA